MRRGRPPGTGRGGGGDLGNQVRSEVQSRVRAMLPEITRTEVNAYLATVLGGGGRRRGRPRKKR